MVEGRPLVRGSMVYNGFIDDKSPAEIISWLSGFTEPLKIAGSGSNSNTSDIYINYKINGEDFDDDYHYTTATIVQRWCEYGDIREISGLIGFASLGVFVRIILRTINFIEEIRTVLLGLEKFETYNRLENYRELLIKGIISNNSLYVV